eukprot:scaffold56129_cov69-Phaeocystis_antarctica.AAC.2
MAMSMLRSSTDVSVTYMNEIIHAATGELVELRAHSKSSAHPAMSEDWGSRSTVQLAAKAMSKKSSSTRK